MATMGHVACGLVAARVWRDRPPRLGESVLWAVLALLPDADVMTLGTIPYGAPFGHRGASHSLVAAAVGGLLAALFARGLRVPRSARFGVLAGLVLASHGILDTMTYGGGRGVALLWPFEATRLWAPWRPIPIAPTGTAMWSRKGFWVLAVETAMFAPFLALV